MRVVNIFPCTVLFVQYVVQDILNFDIGWMEGRPNQPHFCAHFRLQNATLLLLYRS